MSDIKLQCQAKTKSGSQCKNDAVPGTEFCYIPSHQRQSGLTLKRQKFVEEYCIDHNATQAIIRAGYNTKNPSEMGYELLQNTSVQEAIRRRMKALAMPAEEAIKKLADWGRGSVSLFQSIDPHTGEVVINLNSEIARKNMHLIREIKEIPIIRKKRQRRKLPDGSYGYVETEEVTGIRHEIKLHDPKDAVDKILRVLGSYSPEKFEDVTKTPKRLVMVVKEKEDHKPKPQPDNPDEEE